MIIMGDSHLIECFKHVLKVIKVCFKNRQEEMVWEGNVSAL